MRAAFFTLGCKVNQYETDAVKAQFAGNGFDIVDFEDNADVYIINSCTVTGTGDKKTRKILRRAKKRNPEAVVVLCGCFPQAFPDKAALISEADIVMGSKNRGDLLGAVLSCITEPSRNRLINISSYEELESFESLAVSHSFSSRARAFVKIQDGCQQNCAYCIIPKARGPFRSKPLEVFTSELDALAASGYKEIVLVGVNLSSYGVDLGISLLDAVKIACNTKGIPRVRLGSLEPELLTDRDILEMSALPNLCPSFHLSLQSGCDSTLRRMRRRYDTAQYRRIVDSLRAAFSGCAITTDIMAGFPGETAEEFSESTSFVEQIGFAKAHIFEYSKRSGTLAAEMSGQIPPDEKSRRSRILTDITEKSSADFKKSMIGRQIGVLFEHEISSGLWEGYSENYTRAVVESSEYLRGKILTIEYRGD